MSSTVRIPTYFSHSYRPEDRAINEFFWELFCEHGFAFAVDPKSEAISTTQLELMMKRSACFVSVVTLREDQTRYLSSPFMIYEHGLAVQADKPRLVFIQSGVSGRYFPDATPAHVFSADRLPRAERIRPLIEDLAARSDLGGDAGLDRLLGPVGVVLPDHPAYNDMLPQILNLIEAAGYTPRVIRLDYGDPFEFLHAVDECDFVLVDVAAEAAPWVYPVLYGRFIPTLKLAHLPKGTHHTPAISPLVGGDALRAAESADTIVLYWSDPQELLSQLHTQLKKLYMPRREFNDLEEGLRYFHSIGRSEGSVFLSNARADDEFAREVGRALDLQNIRYFHYLYRNTIEIGSDWSTQLLAEVGTSKIFVPLLSEAYWASEWCREEYRVAERLRDDGKLVILPYFLDDSAGKQVRFQGVTIAHLETPRRVGRIIADLDHEFLARQRSENEARRAATSDYAPIGPVDIAIITVLPEEYDAVHACLPEPRQVLPTHEHLNNHAWVRSSIPALGRSSSFEVVLARGPKGPGEAHNTTTATIEAFQPDYVLLVGIAGGLNASLNFGDVVVSSRVYGYEYGKLDEGFYPRSHWNYPTDTGIAALADSMRTNHPRWTDFVKPTRPDGRLDVRPTVMVGPIASGSKVVDDISDASFAPVLQGWPDLVAVEMESLGSMQAVDGVRQRRQHWVQFSTIRGISDIPKHKHPRDGEEPAPAAGPPESNPERNAWKLYAAGTAAAFTVQAIRCAWPRPPKPQPTDVE